MLRFAFLLLLLLLLFPVGCQAELTRQVEGLERKVEGLEQQQRDSVEALEQAQIQLDKQQVELNSVQRQLDDSTTTAALKEKLGFDELELRVLNLEKPGPSVAGPVAGFVAGPVAGPMAAAREHYRMDLGDAHVLGPATAKVTLVVVADFECPYCGRVQKTLKDLRRIYKADLRIVAKHNPLGFHKRAMSAALAAEAAGEQGKFWEMHDTLYRNQSDLTEANYIKWASILRLDVGRFKRDLKATALTNKINADMAQAKAAGAKGTPAFFINGRYLSGAQPIEAFKTVIDAELKTARRMISRGTAPARVYAELMATAKPRPQGP